MDPNKPFIFIPYIVMLIHDVTTLSFPLNRNLQF